MTTRTAFDWSQFTLGIFINAQPDAIFALWSTSEGLTKWFLRECEFASDADPNPDKSRKRLPHKTFDDLTPRPADAQCRAGDRYRWEWYYDGGICGEQCITACRPPSKLSFGFGDRMTVEVTIRKRGPVCEVSLRQHGIPTSARGKTDLHLGCRVAWAFFLTNLKSVAEGGLDLRETDRARSRQLHLVNI